MKRDGKKVLVTGGTGFVGSHLVEALLALGHDVACLVRDPSRLRWLSGLPVRVIRGDCSVPGSLPAAIEGVSVVYHAAGLTKARKAREYYEVNQIGTRNLLDACAGHSPELEAFVLVSSLAAAGPSPDGGPVRDTDPPRPVSDYGRSKLLAEEEVRNRRGRFPVTILRPSAVYGPRDADMFELFRWASRGLTVEIGGGDRFIQPCHVQDLVTALLLAGERRVPSDSVYFVAEARPYSWKEFQAALLAGGGVTARRVTVPLGLAYLMGLAAEAASVFTGKAALTNRQKVREAAQKHWICDVEKIARDLGFHAAWPLDRGLAMTWSWYRENGWL